MRDDEMREDEEFFEWMEADGVRPIKGKDRIEHNRSARPRLDPRRRANRLAAMGGSDDRLTPEPAELLNPLDPIEWKRDGVQEGVYRNLRLGRYTVDARLDLLHRPLSECADEVVDFVQQCVGLGIRTVLINFGRSRRADAHSNQVKSCLNLWLPALEEVMAFHGAQPQHGGSGAVYVLLRKNAQQRMQNLERHQHHGR
ncbi:DNA endonuclease SmrA [Marinobacterium litorale]|uniref:DNA endonuclease SmrA n=1 Tax=Marinobacterium litorale TaxID=404770 RepID=UPI00040A01C2|nr:DNA endonuclease SmrA [Marinobacterium litorale]